MRRAELIMAICMGIFSSYMMWKAAELPYGWIEGEGPGGGMFPFWLSAGMFLCCIWILYRWVKRTSPPSQDEGPFIPPEVAKLIYSVCISIAVMVGLMHFVGVYGSIPIFFIWYMRTLGDHSWKESCTFAIIVPIITFFFFEILLNITLPKGVLEPLFYPLFDLFM